MVRTSSRVALAALVAALAVPAASQAQTFTVQKFDIKGEGGTDYLTAEPGTGRVFVSRGTHVMVVDGPTGKVIGDIPDTPRMHGIALAPKENHGFTTNAGDSTLTMFDLKTLAFIKKIKIGVNGADGIMYDDATNTILSINHSSGDGTAVVVDAKSGDVKTTVKLSGTSPEGGVSDGKGHIYINIENKSVIDVIDTKTWTKTASWDLKPCEGPTGIAMDRSTNRIMVGCDGTSVIVDAASGKVVAQIKVGEGVDAVGWDQSQKLFYVPAGGSANVTVVHEDSPDKWTTVATVETFKYNLKTIAVDDKSHMAYLFGPEFGPAPAPAPGAAAPAAGRGGRGGPRGPIVAGWFVSIKH